MRKGFWKAAIIFALLALLIVWAFPSFKQFQCRAKQSEARMGLEQLADAEHFYRNEHQHYETYTSFEKKYYRFSTESITEKTFELRATGLPKTQVEKDIWSIDERGELKHVHDGCTP